MHQEQQCHFKARLEQAAWRFSPSNCQIGSISIELIQSNCFAQFASIGSSRLNCLSDSTKCNELKTAAQFHSPL